MGGIITSTGEPDGPPTSVGCPSAISARACGARRGPRRALRAAAHRQGQKIECSLSKRPWPFPRGRARAGWRHVEPTRMGSRHRQNAPYQRFETKDGYMMLGASGQASGRLRQGPGHPEWADDPRFRRGPIAGSTASSSRRRSRRAGDGPTAHWIKALDDAGVPCGPVYNYEQLFADPQCRTARWWSMPTTRSSTRAAYSHADRMSSSDVVCARRRPARPAHGHDPRRAGYASADIDRFTATAWSELSDSRGCRSS